MAKRGRPTGSRVRDNIVNILYIYEELHGYKIHTVYNELFPEVSRRTIYYHLEKGQETGEITLKKSKVKKGNYSWGDKVRRKYYGVGPKAQPKYDKKIKRYKEN